MKHLLMKFAILILIIGMSATLSAREELERAANDANERIVGGEIVTPGKGPWAVRLNITRGGQTFICGASLVSPVVNEDGTVTWQGNRGKARWLITAAHCLYDSATGKYLKPEAVKAITGRLDLETDDGEKRDVIAIIPHPGYATDKVHDIALMVLDESDTSLSLALRRSMRLPTISDGGWIDNPYLALIAQGWGRTTEAGNTSRKLLEVRVPLVDRQICADQYATFGESIPEGQICAGFRSGGFDACAGDSGGPLLYRPASGSALSSGNLSADEVLIGAVSWGIGCARQDLFGVYTSVARYRAWLADAVYTCLKDTPSIEDCDYGESE